MQTEPLPAQIAVPEQAFRWLPDSAVVRLALAVGAAGLAALTFFAYLRPNMVFDFANLFFCG